jgi:hypothetical protein
MGIFRNMTNNNHSKFFLLFLGNPAMKSMKMSIHILEGIGKGSWTLHHLPLVLLVCHIIPQRCGCLFS